MFPVADVIPSRTRPYVTIGLIALNAVVFLTGLLLGDALPRVILARGLVPAFFSWPDILSSMFLHTGWLHFLGNMLYLWIFGDNVEDRLGRPRYLAFYIACGAAAALGHVAFNPGSVTPAIGASGAISGVMGAYFVLYPRSRVLTAVFLIVVFDLVEAELERSGFMRKAARRSGRTRSRLPSARSAGGSGAGGSSIAESKCACVPCFRDSQRL
jgi:membrane associated rhomboid family serine protease